ncbi:MAG: anti-sigma factor domain-containing protein, partial [Phycisphaerales bacterium]
IPPEVRARCLHAGRQVPVAPRSAPLRFTPTPEARPAAPVLAGSLGWLAAAACLALAVVAWWPSGGSQVEPIVESVAAPEVLRERLVREAADLVSWRWQAWGDEYAGVTGDVVWSEERQEGYMLLAGLPVNDPKASQYQLWIVESSRGVPLETEPVDGGLFNVTDEGEIVVPIRAKLPCRGVAAFAVTLEPPGGVVVSDQSRKVVLAAPPPEPAEG